MKKVIAASLALLMTVTMMMGAVLPVSAESSVAGDVTGDGRVNALDALVALRVISGQSYTGTMNARGLFTNGDAIVDMADLVQLLRYNSSNWDISLVGPAETETVAQQALSGTYYIQEKAVKFVSQNLLHSSGSSSPAIISNANRVARMTNLMKAYDPDVCGLVEYRWSHWYTAFEENIFPINGDDPEYEAHIVCRVDLSLNEIEGAGTSAETPKYLEEKMAIFWKNDRFDLCTDADGNAIKGNFWFSTTPDVMSPMFGTEDDELTPNESGVYVDGRQRQCIWVKLHDNETGKEFYYYNIHGPNAGDNDEAVAERLIPAMNLLVERTKMYCEKYGDAPVVLGGDFNMNYNLACDLSAYNVVVNGGFDDMAALFDNYQGTFPRYGNNINADGVITARIDFHFTDGDALPVSYKVMEEVFDENNEILVTDEPFGGLNPDYDASTDAIYYKYLGRWASDHVGLCSEFVF